MSDDPQFAKDGFVPLHKGYTPSPALAPTPDAGHQPLTTGEGVGGGPGTPPNQPSFHKRDNVANRLPNAPPRRQPTIDQREHARPYPPLRTCFPAHRAEHPAHLFGEDDQLGPALRKDLSRGQRFFGVERLFLAALQQIVGCHPQIGGEVLRFPVGDAPAFRASNQPTR